jgi:hypothetical protein
MLKNRVEMSGFGVHGADLAEPVRSNKATQWHGHGDDVIWHVDHFY